MSRARAPTAMRTPISRVRSVTETSMMFMMPMPPTSSETAAMAMSSVVRVLVPSCWALAISEGLRIWKSSSASTESRWRSRSRPRTCCWARALPSSPRLLTMMTPAM